MVAKNERNRGAVGRGGLPILAFALLSTLAVDPAAAQSSVAEEIRSRVEQLGSEGQIELAGDRVAFSEALVDAYRRAGYQPLWTEVAAQADLGRALFDLPSDGLDASWYHRDAIVGLAAASGPVAAAERDLLRTAALVELTRDLSFGRVRPSLAGIGEGGFASEPRLMDGEDLLDVIRSGAIRDKIARVRHRQFVYRGLRDGLERLRRIAEAGGWGTLPGGPALRRDSVDARIAALRRRLATEGYAAADSGSVGAFDAALERAVRAFQHHHGLNEDGIVGESTRTELNVPVETRIDQVRVNLERARWLGSELPARFVVVNTAGAKVYVVSDDKVVFETRAIVGQQYTRTPLFSATMRTVELDPTWTVPPGIVDEVLAEIRKDPGYLARESMRVLDERGRSIDPAGIDFSRYSGGSFPYVFRQDPGPRNPLGRIKLLFPNRHSVYLHDTPSRSLFEREVRTFSHGCIRVADPFGLAEVALDDPSWSRAALEAATGNDRTRTIPLTQPIPVLVFYWTASADERGELHFYRDQYGRDAAILEAIGRTPPIPAPDTALRMDAP
jgi:murein L,D-transpeptidase YcbB/YkuD